MDSDRFSVSGWEDDLNDIDLTRNPKDQVHSDILNACENGQLDLLKTLIENHPDLINVADKDKYTPLHRACYSNHVEIVRFLIQHGANVAAETEMKWQPLHSCCQWNSIDCAMVLLQNGAEVNAKSEGGQTPLHIAASSGAAYETVQMLLMHPFIDATIKNNNGETARDIATRSSRFYNIFEMVDPLLDVESVRNLK